MLHLLMLLGQECLSTEKLTEKLGLCFILIDCAFNRCRLLFIYCRLGMSTYQRLDPVLLVLIGISCNIISVLFTVILKDHTSSYSCKLYNGDLHDTLHKYPCTTEASRLQAILI
jgi:hypothetical protein